MSEVCATPAPARRHGSLAEARAPLGNRGAVKRQWLGMPPFSVSVHHGPYLLLVATGDAALDDLVGLVDLAQRLSREKGYTRVLADLISIEVLFSEDDYRKLQLYAVEALRHLDRMAYTVPACYATGKPAPPALRGGVAVRTFSDLGQACQWIAS
jgi:hypothetical protein